MTASPIAKSVLEENPPPMIRIMKPAPMMRSAIFISPSGWSLPTHCQIRRRSPLPRLPEQVLPPLGLPVPPPDPPQVVRVAVVRARRTPLVLRLRPHRQPRQNQSMGSMVGGVHPSSANVLPTRYTAPSSKPTRTPPSTCVTCSCPTKFVSPRASISS